MPKRAGTRREWGGCCLSSCLGRLWRMRSGPGTACGVVCRRRKVMIVRARARSREVSQMV